MKIPNQTNLDRRDSTSEDVVIAQQQYSTASLRKAVEAAGGFCADIFHFPDQPEILGAPVCEAQVEGLIINRRAKGSYSHHLHNNDEVNLAYVAERLAADPGSTRGFLILMRDRTVLSAILADSVLVGRNGRLERDRATYEQILSAVEKYVNQPSSGYTAVVAEVMAHIIYANFRQCGVAVDTIPIKRGLYESELIPTYEDFRRHYLEYALETALTESGIGQVGRGVDRSRLTLQGYTEAFTRAAGLVTRYVMQHDCYVSDFDMVMTLVFVDLLRKDALKNCEYDTRPGSELGLLMKAMQSYINFVWLAVEAYNEGVDAGYPDLATYNDFSGFRLQQATQRVSEWATRMLDTSRYANLTMATLRDATKQSVISDYRGRTMGAVLSLDTGSLLTADVRFIAAYNGLKAEDHIAQPEASAYLEKLLPTDPKLFSYEFMHQAYADGLYNMRAAAFVDLTWDKILPHALAAAATSSIEIHFSDPQGITSTERGKFSLGYLLRPNTSPDVVIDGSIPFQVSYGEIYRTSNPLLALAAQGDLDSSQLPVQTFGHQTVPEGGPHVLLDTSALSGFLTRLTAKVGQQVPTQFDAEGNDVLVPIVCDFLDIIRCRGIIFNQDEQPLLSRFANPLSKHLFHIHFKAWKCLRDWLETERGDSGQYASAADKTGQALNHSFYLQVIRAFPPAEIARITSNLITKYSGTGYFSAFNTRQLDLVMRANVRGIIIACIIKQLFDLRDGDADYFLLATMHRDLGPMYQADRDLKVPLQLWHYCG